MSERLYTVICDFRDGTYSSQVRADDEAGAVQAWAVLIAQERPMGRASFFLARNALRELEPSGGRPGRVPGLVGVWSFGGRVGDAVALCSLVLTAGEPDIDTRAFSHC